MRFQDGSIMHLKTASICQDLKCDNKTETVIAKIPPTTSTTTTTITTTPTTTTTTTTPTTTTTTTTPTTTTTTTVTTPTTTPKITKQKPCSNCLKSSSITLFQVNIVLISLAFLVAAAYTSIFE